MRTFKTIADVPLVPELRKRFGDNSILIEQGPALQPVMMNFEPLRLSFFYPKGDPGAAEKIRAYADADDDDAQEPSPRLLSVRNEARYFSREGAFDRRRCDGDRHTLKHIAGGLAYCWRTSGLLWRARHLPQPDKGKPPVFLWENVGVLDNYATDEEQAWAVEAYSYALRSGYLEPKENR